MSLALLTGVLLSLVYAGFAVAPSYTLAIIFSLAVSTFLIYYFLFKRSRDAAFTQYYLLSIVLKMLGYGTFVLVIIFTDRAGATGNAVLFLVSYLLFTVLEIGFLFTKIDRGDTRKTGPKRI